MREILPVPLLQRPPEAPPALAGFVDLSGGVLPVVRLAVLLGLEAANQADPFYGHIVRLRRDVAARRIGLLVDRAVGLLDIDPLDLKAAPAEQTLNGLVEAEYSRDGQLTHVLALERLLLAEERAALDAWTRRAAARTEAWNAAP